MRLPSVLKQPRSAMAPMIATFAVLLVCSSVVHSSITPQQILLSFGDSDARVIVVTWSTYSSVAESFVQSGLCYSDDCNSALLLINSTSAVEEKFVDGGQNQSVQYFHRAWLSNMLPNQKYAYRCGSAASWSDIRTFRTAGASGWAPRIAVFGDLGWVNPVIVPAITEDVKRNMYDAIIDVGDFAYDLNDDEASLGDSFMNMIQPFTSLVPFMVCPGNHEKAYNFSHYFARFTMPERTATSNMYYSFNLGPIHFVAFSTEFYFYPEYYSAQHIKLQYDWIVQDLTEANQESNRNARPWIVVYGHRPMYCSDSAALPNGNLSVDCTVRSTYIREGNTSLPYGLERVFYEQKVDLVIWGHIHFFERTWPVYDNKVFKTDNVHLNVYKDPAAPVHIVSGAGGNRNGLRNFSFPLEFSAKRVARYTYGRMTGWNKTHLSLEHVAVVSGSQTETVDDFWMIKSAPPGDGSTSTKFSAYTVLVAFGALLSLLFQRLF